MVVAKGESHIGLDYRPNEVLRVMKIVRICATVIARFLISLVFLAGAVSKILHWHETERMVMGILCEWQSNLGFSESMTDCLGYMIPWSPLILIVATLLELVGGLSVLLGIKEKWGALLLIIFLIPATIIMHQFWFAEGNARELQMAHFFKNAAIIGGLLFILLQQNEKSSASFTSKF